MRHRQARAFGLPPIWPGLILVPLLLLVGCGLSADDGPRSIALDDLPADILEPATSTSTTLTGVTSSVTVYLLRGQGDASRLVPVQREVEGATEAGGQEAQAGARIRVLLDPLSETEQAGGLVSSIPADTILIDTSLDADTGVLTVDLSGALFDVQLKALANAFAQIVWTVTELDGVTAVRFRAEGEEYRALNAEGIEQSGPVSRSHYRQLSPA